MIKKFLNIKMIFFGTLCLISLTAIVSSRSYGYVMPAEQLLDLMTDNFARYRTLAIIQSTLQIGQDNEKVFKEQIQVQSPDLFSLKVLDQIAQRTELPNMVFRQFLIANSEGNLEQILSMMGVNLKAVSLTRIEGVIAYRIGEAEIDMPKLIIEKERFLPLLFVYRLPGDMADEVVTVAFEDYRKDDEGWFPYEISYSVGNRVTEKYSIQTFQYNVPINRSLLQPFEMIIYPAEVPEKEVSDMEEEDLRDIIRALEEESQ
jgi:hypothetical protein